MVPAQQLQIGSVDKESLLSNMGHWRQTESHYGLPEFTMCRFQLQW
jgi:hypothetical protein